MGQQQLLLLVLGLIVIGVAIALAITLFRTNAIASKRDMLANECMSLGTMAMEYYRKPVSFGGGGREFTGWRIPTTMVTTENGHFNAEVEKKLVVITGTGNEVITGTDSIKVQVTIFPDNYQTEIIN
jgi:hypothetical protein